MQARSVEEMNHLIMKLAAIRNSDSQVRLNPEKEGRSLSFGFQLEEGRRPTAMFSIGDQKKINQWFEHLEKTLGSDAKPVARTFGVHRYTEPPKALPPTLTLYLGNENFDLEKLRFPPNIKVVSDFSDYAREKFENKDLLKKLDALAARHTAAVEQTKTPTK